MDWGQLSGEFASNSFRTNFLGLSDFLSVSCAVAGAGGTDRLRRFWAAMAAGRGARTGESGAAAACRERRKGVAVSVGRQVEDSEGYAELWGARGEAGLAWAATGPWAPWPLVRACVDLNRDMGLKHFLPTMSIHAGTGAGRPVKATGQWNEAFSRCRFFC